MDTPGGAAFDSDSIYHALVDYKTKYNVPVYAYVDGLCASGGMYISSAADKIYASEQSTIGSVGVIMGPAFNFSGLMTKYGVEALTLTEGKDKDMLNPFRPWQPNEGVSIKNVMAATYEQFVTVVARARPNLSREKLVGEYGANVFIAKEAETLGYIDEGDSNYSRALTALVQAAGVDDKHPYQVVQLNPPRPLLPQLTQTIFKTGTITHRLDLGPQMDPALSGKILYLYQPSAGL
jgi:signal peptide peptidase SppA